MTRFFVVRHGNTFCSGDVPLRIGSRTDLPLVQEGCDQASALGRYFKQQGIVFARALSGELQRTLLTATIIVQDQPSPPMLESAAWLSEIDHGVDEKQQEPTVRKRLGRALDDWNLRGVPPKGWTVDAEHRIAAWKSLFSSPATGDVLLVTSNGSARFALLALDRRQRPAKLHLRTGAFGVIQRNEQGELILAGWDERPSAGHAT